jgi:hypothetical protein
MTEVQGAAYSQVKVPEKRPETNPRPEAWEPGAPNYPWWTVNHKPKPEPDGGRLCELYLLAWIKELTRQHAADWLDLETSRADLEKQLVNLRKQSQVRGD